MNRTHHNLILLVLATPLALISDDVLQHHRNGTRDGLYVDPLITQATAARIHRDATFSAPLPGPTYAQPLYVTDGPGNRPTLIVATEQNAAIDASDGYGSGRVISEVRSRWRSSLAETSTRSASPALPSSTRTTGSFTRTP